MFLLQYSSSLIDIVFGIFVVLSLLASVIFRLQSQRGETALSDACMEGRLATVQYLVAQGADINITDEVSGARNYYQLCDLISFICCCSFLRYLVIILDVPFTFIGWMVSTSPRKRVRSPSCCSMLSYRWCRYQYQRQCECCMKKYPQRNIDVSF